MKMPMLATAIAVALCYVTIAPNGLINEAAAGGEEVQYNPPDLGAPTRRAGAGTRDSRQSMTLHVLAPEHTGHVIAASPKLYWYISEKPQQPVRVVIRALQPAAEEALLDTKITVETGGLQALALADQQVELEEGVLYEWSVVWSNAKLGQRVLSSATLKRVSMPEALANLQEQQAVAEMTRQYAAEGIWFDTIEQLSTEIEQLQAMRDSLLEQVALPQLQ